MKINTLIIILLTASIKLIAQNPLNIPTTLSGENINLTLQKGKTAFFAGDSTNTMGVNGVILGPTLVLDKGQNVDIKVTNNIDEITTIHWHGMHVSPENDGGPHTTIAPNETWNPSFEVMDHASTYWYHPHLHEKTNEHVLMGMAGVIIVRDSNESSLNLPRTYGVDDFPLVLQSKAFDSLVENQIDVNSALDSSIIINGTIDPYLDVPAQVVRLRVLNGSSERYYNIGLSDNRDFYQIGSDGGLLKSAVKLKKVLIAPGERMEFLVDFTGESGSNLNLVSYGSELFSGYYGSGAMGNVIEGYYDNPLNGNDFTLMQLNVVATTNNPVTSIPLSTLTDDEPLVNWYGDPERDITFGVASNGNGITGPFGFVDRGLFSMNKIDDTVGLGVREVWNLANGTMIAHPFHIHDVQFYILKRNGSTNVPANEKGRKDVVVVPPMGTVQFIAEFNDFANDSVPYMYHCHMLTHEDGGMMGQFLVMDLPSGTKEEIESDYSVFNIYPNPANENFMIDLTNSGKASLSVFDNLGRNVFQIQEVMNGQNLKVNNLEDGIYLIYITQGNRTEMKRLVVKK